MIYIYICTIANVSPSRACHPRGGGGGYTKYFFIMSLFQHNIAMAQVHNSIQYNVKNNVYGFSINLYQQDFTQVMYTHRQKVAVV